MYLMCEVVVIAWNVRALRLKINLEVLNCLSTIKKPRNLFEHDHDNIFSLSCSKGGLMLAFIIAR